MCACMGALLFCSVPLYTASGECILCSEVGLHWSSRLKTDYVGLTANQYMCVPLCSAIRSEWFVMGDICLSTVLRSVHYADSSQAFSLGHSLQHLFL